VTPPSPTFFDNGASTDNYDDDYPQGYYSVDGLLFQNFSIPLPISEDEKVLPELLASLLNVDPHCLDNDRCDDSTDDLAENIVLPAENFLLINLDDFNDFLKKFFKTRNYVRGHPLRRQWSRCKNGITQKWHVRYINSTMHLTTRNFVFVRSQIVVAFLLSATNIQLGIQMHAFAAKLSGMDIQCRIKYSPSLAMQIPGVTIGLYDDSCRHQTPLTDVFQTTITSKALAPKRVLKKIKPNYFHSTYCGKETVDDDFKTSGLQLVVQAYGEDEDPFREDIISNIIYKKGLIASAKAITFQEVSQGPTPDFSTKKMITDGFILRASPIVLPFVPPRLEHERHLG
jgi:hypothetical protein